MSYCTNPSCPNPENPNEAVKCQACGSRLRLRNRYLVVKPIGKGGFGATFLARDLSLPGYPACVVKQLRPSATSKKSSGNGTTAFSAGGENSRKNW